jgi:lysozyme family protein
MKKILEELSPLDYAAAILFVAILVAAYFYL